MGRSTWKKPMMWISRALKRCVSPESTPIGAPRQPEHGELIGDQDRTGEYRPINRPHRPFLLNDHAIARSAPQRCPQGYPHNCYNFVKPPRISRDVPRKPSAARGFGHPRLSRNPRGATLKRRRHGARTSSKASRRSPVLTPMQRAPQAPWSRGDETAS